MKLFSVKKEYKTLLSNDYLDTFFIRGDSGREYKFYLFPNTSKFIHKGAVYAFVNRSYSLLTDTVQLIYIGKATNLNERLASHEKWLEAYMFGFNHVGVHFVPDENTRTFIESDLINGNFTPLNFMHPKQQSWADVMYDGN